MGTSEGRGRTRDNSAALGPDFSLKIQVLVGAKTLNAPTPHFYRGVPTPPPLYHPGYRCVAVRMHHNSVRDLKNSSSPPLTIFFSLSLAHTHHFLSRTAEDSAGSPAVYFVN